MHIIYCQREPVWGNHNAIDIDTTFPPQRSWEKVKALYWENDPIKYQYEASMLCAQKTKLAMHSYQCLFEDTFKLDPVVIVFAPPDSEI